MATLRGDRLSPRPAWVGTSQGRAPGKLQGNPDVVPGCPPAGGSEASRARQAAGERGHDARRLPSDLGSERKKGLRLGVSSTQLCSQLANAPSAQGSCGLGAPGRRQPAEESPRRASYAARTPRGAPALWRPRSLARPLARLSAGLSAATARAAAAAAAPSRRVTPPLKPEPFPGRRRPLCQSAPRAGPPRLRSAPRACERPGHHRHGEMRQHPPREPPPATPGESE